MRALRIIALSLVVATWAFAQGATVVSAEGTGQAAVVEKNEQKAIADAKQQALRAAVEQAAGVRIQADTVVVNNQLVRDQVLSNTSGYVKKYDVTSSKVEKGVATVTVKADIITESLEKDIEAARALVKRMGSPSIVIAIQEQTSPLGEKNVITTDTLSKFLAEALANDGWVVKDPAGLDKDFKLGASIASGDAQVVKNVGALSKANFVVYGNAAFRHQDPGALGAPGPDGKQQFFPISGEYGLNIYKTDTGDQIGRMAGAIKYDSAATKVPARDLVLSYERSTFNVLKANRDLIVAELRKAIVEHLRNQAANGTQISLTVNGLPTMGAVKEFGQSISTLKGVKDASFQNDFKKGTASFRVTFVGQTSEFAEAVEAATFKKKKLEVVGSTANTMDINIAK